MMWSSLRLGVGIDGSRTFRGGEASHLGDDEGRLGELSPPTRRFTLGDSDLRGIRLIVDCMATQDALIRTKLLAPVRRDVLARPEALAALRASPDRRLVLLRAPAGWGKSSLLQAWHVAEAEDRDFAWLALDPGDNDPVRFFTYLIEAMRTLRRASGSSSLDILRAPGVSLVDDVFPSLFAELEALPRATVLVIDDYHLIDSPEVHEAVGVLLEYLPPTLEIAISSRTEPPLSLARFRGRGQLAEITTQRASVHHVRKLKRCSTKIKAWDSNRLRSSASWGAPRAGPRVSTWRHYRCAAALTRPSSSDDFAGDDRHLVDYLTAEVLERATGRVARVPTGHFRS